VRPNADEGRERERERESKREEGGGGEIEMGRGDGGRGAPEPHIQKTFLTKSVQGMRTQSHTVKRRF